MPNRIITCSDGTWNRPGEKDGDAEVATNVQRIYNLISEGEVNNNIIQHKFYDSGVGSSDYDKIDQIRGGISGKGIDKNIKDAYSFISLHYQPGDELYLFGFSRGAYSARSLAGFIRNCGILKTEYIHLIDKAYELYRDRNIYSTPDSALMTGFRKHYAFANITPIKFIGVWDTVGSLGVPLGLFKKYNLAKYNFHDVKLSSHVENAYHALAVDERRRVFEPTLWVKSPEAVQNLEQRWFIGVHSNVGGGYKNTDLSNIPLKWMVKKASDAGLHFRLDEVLNLNVNPFQEAENSLSLMYKILGSKWRTIELDRRDEKGNKLHTNEIIDESVLSKVSKDPRYMPHNLIHLVSELHLK